jgi:hypothetical protein
MELSSSWMILIETKISYFGTNNLDVDFPLDPLFPPPDFESTFMCSWEMFLVPSSPSHVIYSFVNCFAIKLWPSIGNSLANKTLGGSSYNVCWF